MILTHAVDGLNRLNDGSSQEIKESLTWKQRLYLRVWPKKVTGSRDLGERLALDHEQAHRLAQELEIAGLVSITPFEGDWLGWEWQDPPSTYSLADVPLSATVSSSRISTSSEVRAREAVTTEGSDVVAENGTSVFRITEDRFAAHGSLGRGALALAWAAEDRGLLGQPVKVADLVAWTGAPRRDVHRWLRRMEKQGAATHHANRSWSLTIRPSQTKDDFDDVLRDLNAHNVTDEDQRRLLGLLDRPIDSESRQSDRVFRHRADEKAVKDWKPSTKRATYEVRSCCRFRHHTPPEPSQELERGHVCNLRCFNCPASGPP